LGDKQSKRWNADQAPDDFKNGNRRGRLFPKGTSSNSIAILWGVERERNGDLGETSVAEEPMSKWGEEVQVRGGKTYVLEE